MGPNSDPVGLSRAKWSGVEKHLLLPDKLDGLLLRCNSRNTKNFNFTTEGDKDSILRILNDNMVVQKLLWGESRMVEVPETPEAFNRRHKQKRHFPWELWYGSVIWQNDGHGLIMSDVPGLSQPQIKLNRNNNSNGKEEDGSGGKTNEASKSRTGTSKSEETTGMKSRHSYVSRRRSTKQRSLDIGQTRASRANAIIPHDNHAVAKDACPGQERMSKLRDQTEAGSSGEPNQEDTTDEKQQCSPSTVLSPDKADCTQPVLENLLTTLSAYKLPCDVPPAVKDQIFKTTFSSFLNGGYNSKESVLTNLMHNPAVVGSASFPERPQHPAHDSDQYDIPEQTAVLLPVGEHSRNLKENSAETGEDLDICNERDLSYRNIHIPDSSHVDPFLCYDEDYYRCLDMKSVYDTGTDDYFNDQDIYPLNQKSRSPSFIILGQDGYSVDFMGQQAHGHIAFDAFHAISPVCTQGGATRHMEDFYDNLVDEIITSPQEPFTSQYVFTTVFGLSCTTPLYYWHIQPPVLPSHLIKWKTQEDGISDKVIGKGCFGEVVAATLLLYPGESRDVVVKEHYMSKTTEEDIIKEARINIHLESTDCVPICYGLLRDLVGNISIVFEFFGSGKTLHNLLDEKTLPREDWLDIACQLAIGLGKIHKKDILINDIKPDNILVSMSDSVPHAKFCDMGSASYKAGVVFEDKNMDVYAQLAPEVRSHAETTTANDVYGLGRVIKKMHAASRISALWPIYEKCMAKRIVDRPTVSALCEMLTETYRKELMLQTVTVPQNGHQLPSSDDTVKDATVPGKLKSLPNHKDCRHDVFANMNRHAPNLTLQQYQGDNIEAPMIFPVENLNTHTPRKLSNVKPKQLDIITSEKKETKDKSACSEGNRDSKKVCEDVGNSQPTSSLTETQPTKSSLKMQTSARLLSQGPPTPAPDPNNISAKTGSSLPTPTHTPVGASVQPSVQPSGLSGSSDGSQQSFVTAPSTLRALTRVSKKLIPPGTHDESSVKTPVLPADFLFPSEIAEASLLSLVHNSLHPYWVAFHRVCERELEKYERLFHSTPEYNYLPLVLFLPVLLFCGVMGLFCHDY